MEKKYGFNLLIRSLLITSIFYFKSWIKPFKSIGNARELPVLLGGIVRFVGHDVSDIVPWMAVESLFQTALIQEMSNEAHAAAQDKQAGKIE